MKYQGIIFDLDGVICSTDEYHFQAWKALAESLGIPFDRERNNLLRGVSRMQSLEIILEKGGKTYTDEEKAAFAEEKNTLYRQLLGRMSTADLSDDVKNTLTALRGAGLRLAVGSSSKNTPFILERIGLDGFFDAVADGNCITHSKPHPEVFLKAAEMIGLPPAVCLVVEDAHAGVEAAVAGGFDCAAIGDAKEDPRAVYHLTRVSDLDFISEYDMGDLAAVLSTTEDFQLLSLLLQLYIHDVHASMIRPQKELQGFARVELQAGGEKTVCFSLQPSRMAFLDEDMRWKIEKGAFKAQVVSSSEDIRLQDSFIVTENGFLKGKTRAFCALSEIK
jgi:beta-phosphoglucomutase